ncbi:MAG: helix-turn-helix transcriptional regulator [Oculatellaceae cyanobacterium bins.114]|nr:helix-turn-helix transcriptional regulator [Oculatellaceae cyanobacterium bins.114]
MRLGGEEITPKLLRERVGLTQQQVAIALGKRVGTVSEWERRLYAPRLTFRETLKLMEIYQCTLEDLAEAFDE